MASHTLQFFALGAIPGDDYPAFDKVDRVVEPQRTWVFFAATRPATKGRMAFLVIERYDPSLKERTIPVGTLQIFMAGDALRIRDAHEVGMAAMFAMATHAQSHLRMRWVVRRSRMTGKAGGVRDRSNLVAAPESGQRRAALLVAQFAAVVEQGMRGRQRPGLEGALA